MIEDNFKILSIEDSDPEKISAKLRCRACTHAFDICTEIFNEKNVSYDLGSSLTVICPSCQATGVTKSKEAKIASINDDMKDIVGREAVLSGVVKSNPRFKPGKIISDKDLRASISCLKCGNEFEVAPADGLNSQLTQLPDGSITVTISCSLCGETDTNTLGESINKLRLSSLRSVKTRLTEELEKLQT